MAQRWPENWVEIHPDDAKKRGIEYGDQVMLYSGRVQGFKGTLLGLEGDAFQLSKLMENGLAPDLYANKANLICVDKLHIKTAVHHALS